MSTKIDLKRCTIRIKDGASTPNEITIKVGDGNLTYSEKKNMTYLLDRGELDDVQEGDQVPVDVKMEVVWDYIRGNINSGSGAGTPSPSDALKQVGNAAAWVSTDADICRPYAVDIEITFDPACATGDTETILIQDFRYEDLSMDIKAGQISVTGKANVTQATVTRSAHTSW